MTNKHDIYSTNQKNKGGKQTIVSLHMGGGGELYLPTTLFIHIQYRLYHCTTHNHTYKGDFIKQIRFPG